MADVMGEMPKHVTKEFIESEVDVNRTAKFRKKVDTPAIRMVGPFECVTSEGNVAKCDDGWLCIDAAGYPYPCNDEEFRRIYDPVTEQDRAYFESMP